MKRTEQCRFYENCAVDEIIHTIDSWKYICIITLNCLGLSFLSLCFVKEILENWRIKLKSECAIGRLGLCMHFQFEMYLVVYSHFLVFFG